jgi:uncharacterized protein YdcH (DUF465 family)
MKWDGVVPSISLPGCVAILSYLVLYLTSWVLFVAALLFDFTISFTLSMTDLVNSFSVIQYGWEVFRNLINLFFILILVFISISTILQVDSYGYKKLLGKLVIAAILINFSMFFTKVIIDVSNITALVFYKQIMIEADANSSDAKAGDNAVSKGLVDASAGASNLTNNKLSLGIMNALGLQTIWGVAKDTGGGSPLGTASETSNNPAVNSGGAIAEKGGAGVGLNPWKMTLVGLGGSIFILMLSFIFFAASFMFLARTAVLIMLMVTSPIAFAANILPQTSGLSSRWWKRLNSAVLFAPVYMLLMFVTLKMVWGRGDKINDLLAIFSNNGDYGMSSVFFFFLLCFMLVMCLTAAASIGTVGAKTMNAWGKSLGTKAKKFASTRATAPVSYLADRASKSSILSRLPGGGMLLQGADKLAQSKLGGSSSYRSRVDADKKMYQARGDLIKKARTGELIRRAGETDDLFIKRKKAQEKEGGEAQREYFGINKNKFTNEVTSNSFNKGKQLAMQEIISKGMSAKEGAFADIENKVKKDALSALKEVDEVFGELGEDAAEISDFITKIENAPEKSSSMDLKGLNTVMEKITLPITRLASQISLNNQNAAALRAQAASLSAGDPALQIIEDRLKDLGKENFHLKNQRNKIKKASDGVEKNINRWQENDARRGTNSAIVENKPAK